MLAVALAQLSIGRSSHSLPHLGVRVGEVGRLERGVVVHVFPVGLVDALGVITHEDLVCLLGVVETVEYRKGYALYQLLNAIFGPVAMDDCCSCVTADGVDEGVVVAARYRLRGKFAC